MEAVPSDPAPVPQTPQRAAQQIPVLGGSRDIKGAARVRGRTPRKARQAGFRILPLSLPLPHQSSFSASAAPAPTAAQPRDSSKDITSSVGTEVPDKLNATANTRDIRSAATPVPPATRDSIEISPPVTPPQSPVEKAFTPKTTRESRQRYRERGRTPRKAQTASFMVQPLANPFSKLLVQSQPKPVTIADSRLDPKAFPPLVAAPERSAAQTAAALQDVLERMRRSRERGNIPATQHISMLPIAQWRTYRPNLATEKTPLIATLALPVAPSNTLSVTPIAPPAPSVLSINHPVLPVLSPVSTPQTATRMRKDQRLYRERGTPRKARNAPFIIKPPGCAGDILTPVVFKKSKLGVTDKIEGGEENVGC